MAGRTRKKAEETPIQKALKNAEALYKAAKEKAEKTKNDANTNAAKAAKTKRDQAKTDVNRERWQTLGGARFGKVIDFIKLLRNCADRRSYEFTAEDVKAGFDAVQNELDTSKMLFENALKTSTGDKKEAKGKTVFKFGG